MTAAPRLSGPAASGPAISGPAISGPAISGPAISGPAISGPAISGPAISGPAISGPATSGPAASGPAASGPAASGGEPSSADKSSNPALPDKSGAERPDASPAREADADGELCVEVAGPLTTVQDLGRPGFAHLGVPRSGALDRPSLELGNRLVGNPPGAAGLEITLGPFVAVARRAGTVALTGAVASLRVGGRTAPINAPVAVRAGERIEVGRAAAGLRIYLAVAGGLAAEPVLSSRSTDTLSLLGPPVVRVGDRLPVGVALGDPAGVDVAPRAAFERAFELRVTWGPRADLFADAARLGGGEYRIRSESNRVGARLDGAALTRADAGELPSEGIVLGSVQVPADGQPLVFLADHPTTGGYPVVAVVLAADLPLLAQARPGDSVRFRGGPQQ